MKRELLAGGTGMSCPGFCRGRQSMGFREFGFSYCSRSASLSGHDPLQSPGSVRVCEYLTTNAGFVCSGQTQGPLRSGHWSCAVCVCGGAGPRAEPFTAGTAGLGAPEPCGHEPGDRIEHGSRPEHLRLFPHIGDHGVGTGHE